MRNRKSNSTSGARRRRFLAQLLASISVGVSANAMAETKLAYYAAHPSEMINKVRTVEGDQADSDRSVLQVHALQDPLALPEPRVPSSSDAPGDDFLSDPPLSPQADQTTDDVDAVVDQALTPVPLQLPSDDASEFFAPSVVPPPLAAPSRARPSLGAVAGSYSAAPNMMGDFFGSTLLIGSLLGRTVALAGGDRRFKIAENTSPIPQDRVFFNYNHFHNALRDINDDSQNLDRFTFGLEKTFLDGMGSIEARVPFASALDSTQSFGATDTVATEFGNIATTLKFDLLSGCDWMLAGGATMTFPTGDDFVEMNGGTRALLIQNEAFHLAPFIGMLKVRGDYFAQAFIQTDFDLNGNDVFTDANGFEGVLQDQNLLFMDAAFGHWFIRNCDPCAHLSGVAAIAELHYTTTMNDTDRVAGVSNIFNRIDVLNATGAINFQFRKTAMRVGAAAPLRGNEENLFDAEVLFQLNRYY